MRKLESAAGLIGLLILLFTTASNADEVEYYTWVDENGVVNYAERNPQGFDARLVSSSQRFGYQTEKPAPREAPPPPTTEAPAEEEFDVDEAISMEKARIDKELAIGRKSNCNIGKLNLAQLQNYNRVKVQGDDGKVRVLTDEEKQARVKEAKDTIRENCD